MADVEQMLARREQIAEELVAAIGRADTLVREEKELAAQIRREIARSGITALPFGTQPDFETIINHELGRAGIEAWRCAAPFGPRLTDLTSAQNRNVRGLLKTKAA
jgi:hypothetical protein